MKNDREKEIRRLMAFKNDLIAHEKKELKNLKRELEYLESKKSVTLTKKRK